MPYTRIRRLSGTAAEWSAANPVLMPAEAGYESQGDGTFKIKIGDGVKHWNDLPYAVDYQAIVAAEEAAALSEQHAATSEANALASKNSAADSAAAALASKNAAKTSEDNASGSAASSLTSKNAAGVSAGNAATSEANALASKNAAGGSATNAANSAAAALASQNAAKTSETNAKNSENNAADTLASAITSFGGFSFSIDVNECLVIHYTDPTTHEVYDAVTIPASATAQELVDTTTAMAGYMRTIAETPEV